MMFPAFSKNTTYNFIIRAFFRFGFSEPIKGYGGSYENIADLGITERQGFML